MNKKLLCILSFFLIALVGCKNTDKRIKQIESKHEIKKNITNNKKKNNYSPEQWLAESSMKGNLWLAAYKGQFDIILQKKNPRIIGNKTSYHLLKNARRILKYWGTHDDLIFNENKINPDYPAFERLNSIDGEVAYISFQSEESVAQVIAAFQYVQELSPEIELLDEAGDKFASSYIELYDSMAEFVNYFYIYRAYRIDGFKLAKPLYDKMRNAYIKHYQLQNQVFSVYTEFYQQVHEQEKALVQQAGLAIRYTIMNVMDDTTSTVNLLEGDELSVEELKTCIEKVAASTDNLELALSNRSQLRKEFPLIDDQMAGLTYLENTKQLLSDMKSLENDLNDHNQETFYKNRDQIELEFQQIIQAYNHLMAL